MTRKKVLYLLYSKVSFCPGYPGLNGYLSQHQLLNQIIDLEEDANIILSYMASNGLAANQNKTVFMLLNMKKLASKNLEEEEQRKNMVIKVGNSLVKRSSSTNLLGIMIEESQEWKEHFTTTINALNNRTFAIRRIADQIPYTNIIKVVQSLWMSKLRYGLQLCNSVRLSNEDPKNANMMSLQVAQNKMLRMMNGTSLKDHITTASLLEKFNLPSVNQLAAEIKIIETWKIINVQNYPVELWPNEPNRQITGREVRSTTTREWKEDTTYKIAKCSFVIDAARIWNQLPSEIKLSNTISKAKSMTKTYCKQLPTDKQ